LQKRKRTSSRRRERKKRVIVKQNPRHLLWKRGQKPKKARSDQVKKKEKNTGTSVRQRNDPAPWVN